MIDTLLEIEACTTFTTIVTYSDENKVPVNVTGYTATMQVRSERRHDSNLLATANITIPNPTLGQFVITLTDTQTCSLVGRAAFYDLIIQSPAGVVTKLIKGMAVFLPSVSR